MSKREETKTNTGRERLCVVPVVPQRALDADVSARRAAAIRINEKKWVNGTTLRYCFMDRGAWRGGDDQKNVVIESFDRWKSLGIGLEFERVNNPNQAEIRIGFDHDDGSWSYVGRDNVDYASDPKELTMNFGWDLTTPYGRDTALHEIGHAIGFSHEHQNPLSGIVWNEPAVLAYFRGPPNNWPDTQIQHNILRKLGLHEVDGSSWDPDSIMHYQFPAGLISTPEKYKDTPLIPAPGLSETDIEEVRRFYPTLDDALPTLRPFQSVIVDIEPGQQLDYAVEIDYSREYTIQTFGQLDTVMVLFEDIDGSTRYIDGDDDSGTRYNARITARLSAGRSYIVRLRLYFAQQRGQAALMLY